MLLELVFVDCVVSPQGWKHHRVESVLVHERVMELTHDILVVRIQTRVLWSASIDRLFKHTLTV